MTDDVAAFGARLGDFRRSAGLSQQELAERSGLSIRAISNLERGRAKWPHLDSVHRLADALGLRDQVRAQFLAATVRRPTRAAAGPATTAPGDRLPRADGGQVVPRQLPGPVRHFVGRENEVKELTGLLDRASEQTSKTLVISVIGGTAGVGKTALAVRWAHQISTRFPDGQLYVNLRGYDPDEPVPAADALAGFLRALGVPGQDIPADAGQRAAQFRSLLAGRRMLVVLDNAGQAEQVRPLLPGSPGCVTVVTSRDALAGLVARDGAVRLDVDLLPLAEAVELLRALLGTRVDADPGPAAALAAQCARLPLALRVAAELATARPDTSLAELADQQRLDLLDAGADPRTGIRAVFSWSYQHLDPQAARLFRLLSLPPGPDADLHAAAALVATATAAARRALDVLARAHLIHATGPGRYAMHDLLHAYARELAARDGEDERQAALTRLFDYYLFAATAAMDALFPAERHRRPQIAPPATAAPPLSGAADARAWLDAEVANLAASTAYTAERGWPSHATRLSATLSRYLAGGGHFPEAAHIHTHALGAARAISDRSAEAAALSHLSQIDLHHGHGRQATSRLRQALALFREADDRVGEARILHNLATVEAQQGRYQQADDHHQQALKLYLATGDKTGAARALHGLGDVGLRLGHYHRAGGHLQRALALCQQTGDWVNEAYVVALLGDLSLRLGRYPHAEGHLTHALGLFRHAEDRAGEAWTLCHLGAAQLRQGHSQLAIDHLQQARAVARESRDRFGEAEALNGLGEACLDASQPGKARAAHTSALGLANHSGDKFEQARAHAGLARSNDAAGNPAQALGHWHQALALYSELGTPEADQIRAQLAPGNHGYPEPFATPTHHSFDP
jgi:tetratricopeptide (TPR) repeat protein/DNA-binding XRE family transcriptional regulator